MYVAPRKPSVRRPSRELKGFAKVSLGAGESRAVEIMLRPAALAFYDVATRQWKAEAGDYDIEVGASSRDIRLRASITLSTDAYHKHL